MASGFMLSAAPVMQHGETCTIEFGKDIAAQIIICWSIAGRGKSQNPKKDEKGKLLDPAVGFMSDGPLEVRTAPLYTVDT
jgi:hypothetical protein